MYREQPKTNGSFEGRPSWGDADRVFRNILNESLESCRKIKNNEQIVREMSDLLNQRVTIDMLYSFTATGKRFPGSFIKAFCEVTRDDSIQRHVLSPSLTELLDFAERDLEMKKKRRELERLRAKLLRERPSVRKASRKSKRGRAGKTGQKNIIPFAGKKACR